MSKGNGHDGAWENLGEDVRAYMSQGYRIPGIQDDPELPSDPRDNDPFRTVWDKVATDKANEHLIDYINGKPCNPIPSLDQIVAVFFEAGKDSAIIPEQVSLLIAFCGCQLAHLTTLRDDVAKRWKTLSDAWVKESAENAETDGYLTISDEPWDIAAMPLRPWIAPPYFMREEIILLHGPGSSGKSQLSVAWAVALALGKSFGRLQPRQRCKVLLTNFEDNAIEQRRRIAAMLEIFAATTGDLKGWLYRVSMGPKGDTTMFQLDEFGQVAPTTCWQALRLACKRVQPDVVFVDPMVAINAVPENANQLMRRVMTVMRGEIAQKFKAALALAHHDNKAGSDDEDSDQTNARGGGDIVNAVRFEAQIKKMTLAQAEGWGIDPARRGFYFRAGSAASKRNYTAPEEAEWLERLQAVIGGEAVVFCVPWEPPSNHLSKDHTAALVEAVEKGTPDGPYSPQLANTSRSLGTALERLGITLPKAQRRALRQLLESGEVVKQSFMRPGHGNHSRAGLRSKGGLPYNYEWCEGAEEASC